MKLRWGIVLAAAICALALAAAWHFGVFSPSPYAHVASIERTSVFRDAALIAEAERGAGGAGLSGWRLRVSARSERPTSAADVLHSVGRRGSQTDVMSRAGVTSVFGTVIPGLTPSPPFA